MVLIVLLFSFSSINAQIEKEKIKLVIPADSSAIAPPSDVPKPDLNKKEKSNFSLLNSPNLRRPEPLIDRSKSLGFGEKSKLLRAGEGLGLEQRLNKSVRPREDENMAVFKRNQFLGDIKTTSGKIEIRYRDHQLEDGDMVKVIINDEVVQVRVVLTNMSKGISVPLKDGFNTIEFKALNQGTSGPNTAEFRVYDENGVLLSAKQWNLATGYKASMVVVKEVE
ncbi:secreted protein [Zhouia amylolytica AD3]|uniref:Secreted protein n=1 Tax=Zhouia amylolytica AD3 TaxID=1286632 RepID=W2UNE2_9FLAO|nr:secreted protein [Zhouia amylolytica AD3]